MSQSIMDYIFRRLALDYMSFEDRSALGIYSAEERQRQLETGSYELVEETGNAAELVVETAVEAPVAREASVTEAAVSNDTQRSEEHTSELQSLMRISYAVFCLKKKNDRSRINNHYNIISCIHL